jgi:DNA-directed RNA polymerase subunit M/transcription elongation factor TFIIS
MKWCPTCDNYLYHRIVEGTLKRSCLKCGHSEDNSDGGLIVEQRIQQRAAEGYKILLNEFTHLDPTLPHVDNIKCPNEECSSNQDLVSAKRSRSQVASVKPASTKDVIYIKYDALNLKFIYICTRCDTRWRSR